MSLRGRLHGPSRRYTRFAFRPAQCTADEVSAFRAAGQCLPEGPANATFLQCEDLDSDASLAQVNPKYRMELQEHSSLDAVMCVAVVNNPVVGNFFTDPVPSGDAALDPSTFDRSDLVLAGGASFVPSSSVPTASTASSYSVGATLTAALNSSTGTLSSYNGNVFAVLGSPDSGSACPRYTPVRFRESLAGAAWDANSVPPAGGAVSLPPSETVRCTSTGPVSSSLCSALSPALLGDRLVIGRAPNAVPSGGAAGYVSPVVTRVSVLDASTGTVSAGTVGQAAVGSSFNATTGACTNAAVQAALEVQYSSAGQVTGATVELVLADLVPASASADFPFQVARSVSFAADAATAGQVQLSAGAGNLVSRRQSGSPGYAPGANLIAGVQLQAGGAIHADQTGLLLYAAGAGGTCVTDATLSSAALAVVRVNEDMALSCGLALDAAGLAAACSATEPPAAVTVNATHVGALGNADPLVPAEWVPLSRTPTSQATTFDADSQTCQNVVTGLHLQFMTAFVGKEGNGQLKVIAARASNILGSWQYSRTDGGNQTFPVQNVVSWVHLPDQGLQELLPPPPTIIPSLPSDFFYPFKIPRTNDLVISAAEGSAVHLGGLVPVCLAVLGVRLFAL